jgi:hypothetical protein
MFSVFGENYYIDLDKLEEYVQYSGVSGETNIHVVKYESVDENLGMKSNEVTIPFKIAFNTLLMKKIINNI